MPPMCTPEKNKVESQQQQKPDDIVEELYYLPRDESISDCSDDEEDEEAKDRMDNFLLTFPEFTKHFNLHGQVGEGTFSTVYVASMKNDPSDKRFAVKHIIPTCHPDRIKFELTCLKQIGGCNNVSGVDLCIRNNNNVIFIMPYQRHESFADYVNEMDVAETAMYMKNLCIALAQVHKYGIIHRDVKPSNFLYDRINKKYLLVDFGLAQKQPENSDRHVPESTVNGKRKRDPLSPINGVVPDSKRPFIETQSPNVVMIHLDCQKPDSRLSQKENDPSRKEEDKKKISFVRIGSSPDVQGSRGSRGCQCYGKPQICTACPLNNPLQASRAGTPGFRPPEVLFKVSHQTTAVDMWAVGVIMLSILSKCTNFFSCPNDLSALLELVSIFGYENLKKIAHKFGRHFICSNKKPALDLRKICCTLRGRGKKMKPMLEGERCSGCDYYKSVCLCPNVPLNKVIEDPFPKSAFDLLGRLLDLNPKTRITAQEVLAHPFLKDV